MEKDIIEKKHRLAPECYIGIIRIAFTICTVNRIFGLNDNVITEELLKILFEVSQKSNCKILTFVFMPDHLHILAEGGDESSNLMKMIKLFKQKSGFWLSKNSQNIRWQKNFYDHILKRDEETKRQIYYILNNPVRKNLCSNWNDYRHKGSFEFDLVTMFE